MKDFLKKHLERVVLAGVALALVVFIGGGVYLQKKHQKEKSSPKEEVAAPKEVQLKVMPDQGSGAGSTDEGGGEGRDAGVEAAGTASFFLEPGPEQLLKELENMQYLNEDALNRKFVKLRVLWPVYFFSLEEMAEGPSRLVLDVSPDGFGVIVESVVNLSDYPQLGVLQQGEKLWIGGEILGVDPSGTGRIYLDTKHVSLGDEAPAAAVEETGAAEKSPEQSEEK